MTEYINPPTYPQSVADNRGPTSRTYCGCTCHTNQPETWLFPYKYVTVRMYDYGPLPGSGFSQAIMQLDGEGSLDLVKCAEIWSVAKVTPRRKLELLHDGILPADLIESCAEVSHGVPAIALAEYAPLSRYDIRSNIFHTPQMVRVRWYADAEWTTTYEEFFAPLDSTCGLSIAQIARNRGVPLGKACVFDATEYKKRYCTFRTRYLYAGELPAVMDHRGFLALTSVEVGVDLDVKLPRSGRHYWFNIFNAWMSMPPEQRMDWSHPIASIFMVPYLAQENRICRHTVISI
ncbi:hypothetical protein SCP_1301270 [Sparassis crispa]|uniref:Uncharacterized protein n=1 Tax=Sparassis crispa TaxID=139825 RepID=A0A401H1P3_9APHY|nr:hypothetical protein SCP_1301270 [Sparassis crispa]GBE88312.1 hypothetical protein SCP_1301270 [Sparassis crispa]